MRGCGDGGRRWRAALFERCGDANIGFDELCALLRHLGFEEKIRGSHHVFRCRDIEELINLQREGAKAKVYQVRQVRAILAKYALGSKAEEGG